MISFTKYQISSSTVNIVVGVGFSNTNLVAAPGANKRVRVLATHVILDNGAAGRVEIRFRSGGAANNYGMCSVMPNQPSDHIYYGEGGVAIEVNDSYQARCIASVAAQNIFLTTLYIVEYVGS